jgi:predicted dinucleotide-binding enzyme
VAQEVAVRIAIVGAGRVGSALAQAVVAKGHTVVLTSRDPGRTAEVAAQTGAQTAASPVEAAGEADMVVLAIPSGSVAPVVDDLAAHLAAREGHRLVVVDPTNPPELDPAGSVAEGIALLLPEAAVVKAFNTIFASRLTDPVVDGIALDGFYAGDDAEAKARVAELLADLGFRPLDTGDLLTARTLEHMALLNIAFNARHGWPWQSGWKLLGPTG